MNMLNGLGEVFLLLGGSDFAYEHKIFLETTFQRS